MGSIHADGSRVSGTCRSPKGSTQAGVPAVFISLSFSLPLPVALYFYPCVATCCCCRQDDESFARARGFDAARQKVPPRVSVEPQSAQPVRLQSLIQEMVVVAIYFCCDSFSSFSPFWLLPPCLLLCSASRSHPMCTRSSNLLNIFGLPPGHYPQPPPPHHHYPPIH